MLLFKIFEMFDTCLAELKFSDLFSFFVMLSSIIQGAGFSVLITRIGCFCGMRREFQGKCSCFITHLFHQRSECFCHPLLLQVQSRGFRQPFLSSRTGLKSLHPRKSSCLPLLYYPSQHEDSIVSCPEEEAGRPQEKWQCPSYISTQFSWIETWKASMLPNKINPDHQLRLAPLKSAISEVPVGYFSHKTRLFQVKLRTNLFNSPRKHFRFKSITMPFPKVGKLYSEQN